MKKKLCTVCILLVVISIFSWVLVACKETPHTHTFENYVCTECGYDKLSDVSWLPQTDYKDVGEKFNTVVKPIYDAAETILQDLIENGYVGVNLERNTRIVGVRCGLRYFEIYIREDTFIEETGEKSEFLKYEGGFSLENFGDNETYTAYQNFILAERKSQSNENYEELVLPYAERSAKMILAQYQTFRESENKEIEWHNYGKKLILSATSSLSNVYENIVSNLNDALARIDYPLITNQDLNVSFGGWNTGLESRQNTYEYITVNVTIGSLYYHFYLPFNKNGEFTDEYINHMLGQPNPAFGGSDSLNPLDEEFCELFARLKIEEIDLSDLADYKYASDENMLDRPTPYSYEITQLYF